MGRIHHFSINRIKAIRRDLPGNHLACNLHAANDYEFDKLCLEFLGVSEATILEVKKHGKAFNTSLDYRR